MGKSAQFPLFTWLPDAMEGPTPVSALIHAATMVAAGVYLLVRIFPIFTPDALTVVACIGMVTAIIGALSALFQHDLKKVLAYSTISQLGLMIMAIGLGIVNAALLHLFTHAFFKACLFLSAGSVIHALHQAQSREHHHFDVQDIRNMGGLRRKLPVTFFSFLLGGASLAGIPFFSGFLSKEAMLAAAWMNSGFLSWGILVTMIGVSFLTVLYTFRLIWYIFMGEERKTASLPIMEAPAVMRGPVLLLALCSLWLVVSWNPFDFIGWLLPQAYYTHVSWLTTFSILWIGGALATAYFIFRTARFDSNRVLENAFYFDLIFQKFFGKIMHTSASAISYIDRKWIDGIIHGSAYAHVTLAHVTGWIDRAVVDGFVNGLASMTRGVGSVTRSFQGGKIQVYIFWSTMAIIIFLIWTLN
jgi:NADH-quinone oxidoreductase subunit L